MKIPSFTDAATPKAGTRPLTDEEKNARAAALVVSGESTFLYSFRLRRNEDAFVCSMADRYQARGYLPVAAIDMKDTQHAQLGEVWFVCVPDRGTRVLGVAEINGPGQ